MDTWERWCLLLLLLVCAQGIKLDNPDLAESFAKRHLRQLDIKQLSSGSIHCPEPFGYFPFPGDCRKYLLCESGSPHIRTCPSNEVYVDGDGCVKSGKCRDELEFTELVSTVSDYSIDVDCSEPFGQFSYEEDCRKYVECIYGIPQVHACPLNEVFSRSEKSCVKSATCITEQLQSTSPPSLNVGRCLRPYGLFPHNYDCHKYIECDNDVPTQRDCPPNEVFTKYGECSTSGECILEDDITGDYTTPHYPDVWECPGDFTVYPVQGDCTKFVICLNSKLFLLQCPENLTFDMERNKCIDTPRTENPSCQYPPTGMIPERSIHNHLDFQCPSTNGKFADFQDCSIYYDCVNGMSQLRSCSPGKHFDHLHNKCMSAEKAECLFLCRQPNGIYPYLSDCRKYVQCANGKPKVKECPKGKAFDSHELKCADNESTGCNVKVKPTKRIKPSKKKDINFKCPEEFGDFPDARRCSSYWRCKGGEATHKACPWRLLFNHETRKCDHPGNVSCPPYKTGKKVICYFDADGPGHNQMQPEDMDPFLCTHIHYRHAVLDPVSLQAKPGNPTKDIDQHFLLRLRRLKKVNPHLKVILSLRSWENSGVGDKYLELLGTREKWDNFTAYSIGLLHQYGYDGMELDWELPFCRTSRCPYRSWYTKLDKNIVSTFFESIHDLFKARPIPLLLALKASGDATIINVAYDVQEISKYFDYITVMAYMAPGDSQYYAEHPARFHHNPEDLRREDDAESIMNLWEMMGAPKDKLVMGIRADGREYALADARNNDINAPIKAIPYPTDIDYPSICKRIQSREWTLVRDRYAGPYMYRDRTWIGYQDPKVIHQKAKYASRKNYAGVALIGSISDDYNATCCKVRNPLLKAAVHAFNRKGQDLSKYGCPQR